MKPVAVDVMGGDQAPEAAVQGCLLAASEGLPVVMVGHEPRLRQRFPEAAAIPVAHAPDQVGMGERPSVARTREGASIRVAMDQVAAGRCRAAVSCGNSGATLVAAVLVLGKLDGVSRPAIATTLPRLDGGVLRLLDVGTTAEANAGHLESFARLGMAMARVDGVAQPRIALLSNGSEPGKGTRIVREATERMGGLGDAFVGPMEPTAAFAGGCDVLVSDGFTGNVLIKTAEAVIGMVAAHARRRVEASPRARLGAWWMKGALRQLRGDLDWRTRGGALLLGVSAPVVVAHGRSDARAVRAAIGLAHYASDAGLVESINAAFEEGGAPPAPPLNA